MAIKITDSKGNSIQVAGGGSSSSGVGQSTTGVDYSQYEVLGFGDTGQPGAEIFNDYEHNVALGEYSHAEGNTTLAFAPYSHTEGHVTQARSRYSHVEGYGSETRGECSHAEGWTTWAHGYVSHAEGLGGQALGDYSHVEGYNSLSAENSYATHVEGVACFTDCRRGVHVEGIATAFFQKGPLFIESFDVNNKTITFIEDSFFNNMKYLLTIGMHLYYFSQQDNLPQFIEITEITDDKKTITTNRNISFLNTFFNYSNHIFLSVPKGDTNFEDYIGHGSHVEGWRNGGRGTAMHIEGTTNLGIGMYSHVEGNSNSCFNLWSAHVEGQDNDATGARAHAEGTNTIASGSSSHSGGIGTLAEYDSQTAIGKFNVRKSPGSSLAEIDLFTVGNGTADTSRSNIFRVSNQGVYGTKAFNASGADYAEYFQWLDENPNKEDRVGRFVTLYQDKIRLADSGDNFILGIVSGAPSVVGDVYDDQWKDMYLTDIFGRPIWEEVLVPEEVVNIPDPNNPEQTIQHVIQKAHTERRQKLNPEYDNTQKYIPRSQRPEWDAVGMLGKLVMVDDGTCIENGYCGPGPNGIASIRNTQTRYRVMKRLDDNHIQVLIL